MILEHFVKVNFDPKKKKSKGVFGLLRLTLKRGPVTQWS